VSARARTASHARPRRRARSGHTLIELLAVTAIMSIMAGLGTMASGQDGTLALDQAEIVVRDACSRAQMLARSSRTPHGVVFDVEGNRFAIVAEDGTAARDPLTRGDAITHFSRPSGPRLVTLDAVDFGDAGACALFDAQGVPLAGGIIALRRDELSRTLTLDAATGAITAGG
jgi:prepilin-type N-terminal cleavage/methylation domain-containing protein